MTFHMQEHVSSNLDLWARQYLQSRFLSTFLRTYLW